MERAPDPGGARGVPREGHGLPGGDGRPRALRQTLSSVRVTRATDRSRGNRDELLRPLPDRREAPGGPRALPAAQRGLASDARRARSQVGSPEVGGVLDRYQRRSSLKAMLGPFFLK